MSLEKTLVAWSEWEAGLTELSVALRSDKVALTDKSGSSCGSLSDSGISDGDSEAARAQEARGARTRRLARLRELAHQLQATLAPHSHAARAILKRTDQAESELRELHERRLALVGHTRAGGGGGGDGGGGGGWWRVVRSALPFQLCLVAVLLAAWLLERPRCCHLLNTLADSLTPTLRYVRGPPPH